MAYYAIGDIHGQYDLMVNLYDKILADIKLAPLEDATIVFLGDYIDRGEEYDVYLRGDENSSMVVSVQT